MSPSRPPARPTGWARTFRISCGALALAAAAGYGTKTLFGRQAAVARARIGKPLGEESIDADRVWRRSLPGTPVELLLLGDSLAAGLGAERRKETLGGRIAKGLAREVQRPVRLRTAAVVGSESNALGPQLDGLPDGYRADVAMIVVGGNDVTHLISADTACAHLERAIKRLSVAGTAVVVGTCPDLGALQAVPQPLRTVLSRMSRRMAAAQARTAERAGAIPVDLRRSLGPIFRAAPAEMFSIDRFHPSAAGYRRTAEALLPAVVRSLEPKAADYAGSDSAAVPGSDAGSATGPVADTASSPRA